MSHPHIAALDRQLARKGEPIVLRRFVTNKPSIDVTIQAFARGYKPSELLGGIVQGDSVVIISPTEIEAAGWPAPPKINDRVIYQGRTRNVQAVSPIYIGGTVIRYDLLVRG